MFQSLDIKILLISGLLGLGLTQQPTTSSSTGKEFTQVTELDEIRKLKAQVHLLEIKLGQCNASLVDRENRLLSVKLSSDQKNLEEEFRKFLGAESSDKFNWNTLKFEKNPTPK